MFNQDDEISSETYDQNGNVTNVEGKTFTYDSENHLVTMTNGSTSAAIIYDGDGNRVSKTVGGVTTKYLVDDLNPTGYPQVVDELTNGIMTRTYTYGLQRIDENQFISSQNQWVTSFYGYDGGGNVRQLTNSVEAVTDTYEYDAYGNEFTVSGSTPNEMMYRGEQFDSDLGLYYLRARYYNPLTGRFMSRDPNDPQVIVPAKYNPIESNRKPLDPKSLHKYLYGSGDPVNRIDPTGRDDDEEYGFLYTEIQTSSSAYEYGFALGVAARYACYGDAVYALLNWVINDKAEGPIDLLCTAIAAGTP